MLYIASVLKIDEKSMILAAALCAETVKHLMQDKRSLDCLNACFDYYNKKITKKQLYAYADAATDATDAALDASLAAAYAAYPAALVANAANAANAAAADKRENQKKTAEICRKHLTDLVFEKILKIK